jgi:hypothetical protein
MPLPASINDLSTTAASNSPAGTEASTLTDDYLRYWASYIALLRDSVLSGTANISTANITYTGTLTGSTALINIGTNQIYKDTSGNIGLGVAPAQKLTVYVGGSVVSYAHFVNGFTGPSSSNGTLVGTDSAGSGIINVQQAYPLIIYTTNIERVRVDASGNVIIRNTSSAPSTPSGGGALYVESGALKYIGSSGTVTTLAPA